MDTLGEMVQAIQDDLTADSTSPFYNPEVIKRAVGRSYRKIGGLYRWPETEDAKKTSTEADEEYYEYPDNWRPMSIWKLMVDDTDYGDPIAFKDYLYEQDNTWPSGLQHAWGNQWKRFFIYPTPTTDGNNNISVWGQKVVDPIVNDDDTTIFSYSSSEGNEAIVLEAASILRTKGGDEPVVLRRYIGGSLLLSFEAKQILEGMWQKILQEKAKYERTQPMFEPVDFFFGNGDRAKNKIGEF